MTTTDEVVNEPRGYLQQLTTAQLRRLSGNAYVSARIRSWAADDTKMARLPIRSTKNCEHTYTVCESRECIESWSCDWNLYLKRTGGGRRLIEALELTDEEVHALCDDSNRPINKLSIAVPGSDLPVGD